MEDVHRRAVAANSRGQFVAAARLLRPALRAKGIDPKVATRMLLTLAWSEAEQGLVSDSFSHLDEAEALAAGLADLAGVTRGQRGILLLRVDRTAEALTELQRAAPLLAGDPIEQARALLHQGVAEQILRRFRAAEISFTRSAALAKQEKHTILAGKAISNLGELAALRGDLPLAIARFDEAIDIFHDVDPILHAITVVDSGYALTLAGLFTEAETDLLAAAKLLATSRLPMQEASAWLSLAEIALTEERASDATTYARRARRSFQRRGADGGELMARAVLAATAVTTSRTAGAVAQQARAVAKDLQARGLSEEAARLCLRVARLAVRAGQVQEASAMLDEAPKTYGGAAIRTKLLAHTVRAEVATAQGDSAKRTRQIRAGLKALQHHQSTLGSFDLQTAVMRHGIDLARMGLQDAIDSGRPRQVLVWLERARSLATRLPPLRPPDDDRMASILESLRHQRLELVQLERNRGSDPAELAQLRQSCRELERAAGARERQLVGSGDFHAEVSPESVEAALGDEGGFVALVDLESEVHMVGVGRGLARLSALGDAKPLLDLVRRTRADLDVLALASTPTAMRSVVWSTLHRSLAHLDLRVGQPVAAARPEGPLVLIATGVLATLPWSLMPSLRGRAITVARSAGEWLRGHEWPPPSSAGSNPAATVFATGPRVARAGEEIRTSAASWPGALELPLASCRELLEAAAGAGVVHVAAHGTHDSENPLFSSLELGDGLVFGHDLTRVRPAPRHVVLSACDLGLATVRPGGESLGMTAALLHGGTSSVIAGVARVADDIACDVAVAYHQRLSGGALPSYALAGALAETGADGSGDWLAPLTCFGSGW
jgi:tetratricopeptide (TPR) repeat protein